MPQFIFAYLGGNQPSSPEEGRAHFEKYTKWITDIGTKALVPMIPLKDTVTINPDNTISDGTTTTMSGYTIIDAESLEAALEVGRACPFLEIGGSLDVSEIMAEAN